MNTTATVHEPEVEYPDSDGKPMAENTLQYEWIVTLKGNLDILFADRPDVFVAGDNLIYPVRGDNRLRQAPDVYVAIGRPKGHRGSYKVWQEGGIFPQVLFEVWSPGNRAGEMTRKRAFYQKYGAREYYILDPDDHAAEGWIRDGEVLREVPDMQGFQSPLLGIRFRITDGQLAVHYSDGRPFLSFLEVAQQSAAAQLQAKAARRQARAAVKELERLRSMLRAAGIDPEKPAV